MRNSIRLTLYWQFTDTDNFVLWGKLKLHRIPFEPITTSLLFSFRTLAISGTHVSSWVSCGRPVITDPSREAPMVWPGITCTALLVLGISCGTVLASLRVSCEAFVKSSVLWGTGIACGTAVVSLWVFWGLWWVWGETIATGRCLLNSSSSSKFPGFLSHVSLFVENFYWDKVTKQQWKYISTNQRLSTLQIIM